MILFNPPEDSRRDVSQSVHEKMETQLAGDRTKMQTQACPTPDPLIPAT